MERNCLYCIIVQTYRVVPGSRYWQVETADWNLDVRLDIRVKKLYASLEILLRKWLAGSKTVVSTSRNHPVWCRIALWDTPHGVWCNHKAFRIMNLDHTLITLTANLGILPTNLQRSWSCVLAVSDAGIRINSGPLFRTSNSEPDFKNGHISRFCLVPIIQVILSERICSGFILCPN